MNMSKNETCELYFSKLSSKTRKGKEILHNLSGNFCGGSLVAILGTSGAGKTTLLNILSGYNSQNATCDTIEINGTRTDLDHMSKISCYLTQDIHLNDSLTTEENLHFAANFKLGVSHSNPEKNSIIEELLDCFGLSSTRSTRAGKLSGGERKRLALALEMISDPQMIYLDEPTTGLDISATNQILTYLKKIASSGKTVICTIHQVCASHFELFDLAYVIAEGQCAYQGRPQDLVSFLDQLDLPCNIYHNPADYLIELCSGDFGKEKIYQLVKASQNGLISTKNIQSKSNIGMDTKATWNYQFRTLLSREYVKATRNWLLTYLRFFGSLFIGFFMGLLFYGVGGDATKFFSTYNLVLCMNSNLVLSGLLYPIISFPLEMHIVKRETYNKYYTVLQYYMTVSIIDLPVSLLSIVSSNMIIYYLSGQPLERDRILIYILFTIAVGTTINAIGFFYGTLFDLNNAVVVGSYTQVPLLLLSGFAIMPQDLPESINTISKFLYLRHGIQGSLVSIFGLESRQLHCSDEAEYCYYSQTHHFLKELRIDPYDIATSMYVLAGWYVLMRFVTYYTMRYRLSVIS